MSTRSLWVAGILAAGCGRIGIDFAEHDTADAAAGADAPRIDGTPGTIDAAAIDAAGIDAAPMCPADTRAIPGAQSVCIEITERGSAPWTGAVQLCTDLGRRLCTDAEWLAACEGIADLVDMANDGGGANPQWEWVADLVDVDVAAKRGYAACTDTSAHAVVDPYDFRCCADL